MFKDLKCANCGNTDSNSLWDEEETIYCSKCCHRTRKDTGEDDLVECPVCHHMRDRTASNCMCCNSTWGADEYDPECEDSVNEFEMEIDSSNIRYGKLKRK